jgi:nitrogen fixation protein NifU and related proteins
VTASRYSAITVDHFQHPRNVGRMVDADRTGHVDDPATDTTVTLYVKMTDGIVSRATFRTFGCSACIAASSIATELLVGRRVPITTARIDRALGGLPDDKRYCAELVARASRLALAE